MSKNALGVVLMIFFGIVALWGLYVLFEAVNNAADVESYLGSSVMGWFGLTGYFKRKIIKGVILVAIGVSGILFTKKITA